MKWTEQYPTQEGYYWYDEIKVPFAKPIIAYVWMRRGRILMWGAFDEKTTFADSTPGRYRWYGPIEPPAPPQEDDDEVD